MVILASDRSLGRLYCLLRNRFGFQDWWPGETTDEIFISAILTQNTSWVNVEKAMLNLRRRHLLDISSISSSNLRTLETAIKPSGFYKQKARRLKNISSYICSKYGSLSKMLGADADTLRRELLSMDGIGPETADCILLYAAEKPIFVVDAYTRRIMSRIYNLPEMEYEEMQELVTSGITKNVELYNDFHAQFVKLGKDYCKKNKPLCKNCPAKQICIYYKKTKGN